MKGLATKSPSLGAFAKEPDPSQLGVCSKRAGGGDDALPEVAQLAERGIARVGITWVGGRSDWHGSDHPGVVFVAGVDGAPDPSHTGKPGNEAGPKPAYLLPPGHREILKAGPTGVFPCVFVWYEEAKGSLSSLLNGPLRRDDFDSTPLVQAIRGLHAEATGSASPPVLCLWIDLIHAYVSHFVPTRTGDERVWQAWEQVKSALDHPWSLKEISRQASMSGEHFRRLCLAATGRSPMKHLHHLRMERAADLLSGSDLKIEAVALEIGYVFASTFSNTFQKWSSLRPSEYRRLRGSAGQSNREEDLSCRI